jgi:hypothetical protein
MGIVLEASTRKMGSVQPSLGAFISQHGRQANSTAESSELHGPPRAKATAMTLKSGWLMSAKFRARLCPSRETFSPSEL